MSSSTDGSLDLREQLARIDRALAETQKFQEESFKLRAEARKMSRDVFLAPFVAAAAMLGGLLGATVFLLRVLGRG